MGVSHNRGTLRGSNSKSSNNNNHSNNNHSSNNKKAIIQIQPESWTIAVQILAHQKGRLAHLSTWESSNFFVPSLESWNCLKQVQLEIKWRGPSPPCPSGTPTQ